MEPDDGVGTAAGDSDDAMILRGAASIEVQFPARKCGSSERRQDSPHQVRGTFLTRHFRVASWNNAKSKRRAGRGVWRGLSHAQIPDSRNLNVTVTEP